MSYIAQSSHCFLISTLAEYQTSFWLKVGEEVIRRGFSCEFLSFDDRSTESLRASGFLVHSYSECRFTGDENTLLSEFDIGSLEAVMLHERVAFNEQRHKHLKSKLCRSIYMADKAIADCKEQYKTVAVIQEVGGFLSVIGCQLAAKKRKVVNWFIEPAFFKGRLFFTRDTFSAPTISVHPASQHRDSVLSYIKTARQQQTIVIPEKDRHHYTPAIIKIANKRNAARLIEKMRDKYILGKYQDFGYPIHHVMTHLRMFYNSVRLKPIYTRLNQLGSFVYFPLHVPGDMALTIRSPEYLDQITLIEHILRAIPLNLSVAVKEHPAMIGASNGKRLKEMCRRFPQLHILPPSTNNYDVIRASKLVVSINSKSGIEALLLNKPVIVLGDAFYSTCALVQKLESPALLRQAIPALLNSYVPPFEDDLVNYLCRVWDTCATGELYVNDEKNINAFCDSLIDQTI